ncbi:MAG: OmpA family protein [Proteobacteria bacterium]|nr:OmpA family protein [Pseudomonadota bacterium]
MIPSRHRRTYDSVPIMIIRMKASFSALLGGVIAVISVSASCVVSESKYKSKQQELQVCQTERDDLAAERNSLRNKLPQLEARMQDELNASRDELEALRKQREELDKQLAEYQSLTDRFKEMVSTSGIKVDVRRGRMIVSLPSSVLFASGKADLSERGSQTLRKVASKLRDFRNRRFIVAGHTDNVPIVDSAQTGFADNWELSTARALNVTRFLVKSGLNPRNIAAAGYAQYDSVRSNKSKRGRQFNRRIELILEPRLPDFRKLARLSKKAGKAGQAKGRTK